ncbi:TPA: Dot/Icm T4SS effector LegK2, partial [Legionella pneumophila]|nr:Dot/Icm T4SS effector LegK2 [Legionella pneumophila]
ADERFWAQDISIAIEMISLLFTTNETNQFKASRYWSDEPTVRRIVNPNPVEAKLNRILNSEYRCVSDLKLAIERNYNEYLNNSNLVLKKNVELESEALGLQAYKNQMSKQQLLGEIQGFKENYWNMKDLLTLTNRHHLRVFLEYLDNICS